MFYNMKGSDGASALPRAKGGPATCGCSCAASSRKLPQSIVGCCKLSRNQLFPDRTFLNNQIANKVAKPADLRPDPAAAKAGPPPASSGTAAAAAKAGPPPATSEPAAAAREAGEAQAAGGAAASAPAESARRAAAHKRGHEDSESSSAAVTWVKHLTSSPKLN